jgi:hypothetical protein
MMVYYREADLRRANEIAKPLVMQQMHKWGLGFLKRASFCDGASNLLLLLRLSTSLALEYTGLPKF